MKTETPFDWAINTQPQKKDNYFLIKTPKWNWAKSDLADGSEPFYDYSTDAGAFLFDCHVDCPICGGNTSLIIAAGVNDGWFAPAKMWVCMKCGEGSDVVGQFGEVQVVPRHDGDTDVFICPECIVVKVQV